MTDDSKGGSLVSISERVIRTSGKDLVVSIAFAFVPSIVLAIELAMSVNQESPAMLWIPWIGFTYLLYRHGSLRDKATAVLFYLAVESFLFPVVIAVATFVIVLRQENGFGQVDPLVGGAIAVGIAAIVGGAVGIALYYVSNRIGEE